jgi:hypothetical protein
MSRYEIATVTSGSVSPSGTLLVDVPISSNNINVVKIKVVPSTSSGTDKVEIFKKSAMNSADLVYATNTYSGTLVDPIENTGTVLTERNEGFIFPYEDQDLQKYLHVKLTNNHTLSKTYDITITYYQAYLPLVINVKDYGATGDGSTDDTAALQAAIDAADTIGANIVFVPYGEYKTTSAIDLYSGIRVVGEGSSTTAAYGGSLIKAYHTGNVFQFDTGHDSAFYHFGGLEHLGITSGDLNNRPACGLYVYQAGEQFVCNNLSLYYLEDGMIFGDGVASTSQVSATLINISSHFHNGAAFRFKKNTAGVVNMITPSGDRNLYFIRVENSGESISYNISGIKTETWEAAPGTQHDPCISLDASFCSINLIGGWIGTQVAPYNATDAIKISTSGRPRIFISGIKALAYTNWINDAVNSVTIPVLRGTTPITEIVYNNYLYSNQGLSTGDTTNIDTTVAVYLGSNASAIQFLDSIGAGSVITGRRANTSQAARSNVVAGQGIFSVNSKCFCGATGYWDTAKISFNVSGTVVDDQRPGTTINFFTNEPNGSVTERWVMRNDGTLSPSVDNTYDIGTQFTRPQSMYVYKRVGVGDALSNSSAGFSGSYVYVGSDTDSGAYLDSISGGAIISGRRSTGSQSARGNVSNGQGLFFVKSAGFSGATGYWDTAEIRFIVDGTVTDNQRPPSRISFYTNIDGGAVTERMRVDGDGTINIASLPAYANNAAAVGGGLGVGDLYRTGGDPDAVCVVH